jgi:single-stranded DNA-binding protein
MKSGATIHIRGFVGNNAEFLISRSGKNFMKFSVGVTNFRKDKESGEFIKDSSWYNVVTFDDLNAAARGIVKGAAVCVEGRPVLNPYIKKTGEPAASVTIIAKLVTLGCHDKKIAENGMPSAGASGDEDREDWGDVTDFDDYGSDVDIPF